MESDFRFLFFFSHCVSRVLPVSSSFRLRLESEPLSPCLQGMLLFDQMIHTRTRKQGERDERRTKKERERNTVIEENKRREQEFLALVFFPDSLLLLSSLIVCCERVSAALTSVRSLSLLLLLLLSAACVGVAGCVACLW